MTQKSLRHQFGVSSSWVQVSLGNEMYPSMIQNHQGSNKTRGVLLQTQ